jgi:hypothetical protein
MKTAAGVPAEFWITDRVFPVMLARAATPIVRPDGSGDFPPIHFPPARNHRSNSMAGSGPPAESPARQWEST